MFDHECRHQESIGCSAPRFAVEIIAVWAVASSLYTVGIVTLCRVILC